MQQVVMMYLLLCGESIVISAGDMDCELGWAPTRRDSLGKSSYFGHQDLALHLFLVDVVNAKIGDSEHSFLWPLQIVDLFDHCSVHQSLY